MKLRYALALAALVGLGGCAGDLLDSSPGENVGDSPSLLEEGDGTSTSVEDDGTAAGRTQSMMALYKRWEHADSDDKPPLYEALMAKAMQRRELLQQIVADAPAEVRRVAIPEQKRVSMPAELVSLFEQRLEVEGQLEVFYEDYPDGTNRLRQLVRTELGDRIELQMSGDRPTWRSGALVRAKGWLLERKDGTVVGDLAVDDHSDGVLLLADGGTTTTTELAADLPNAFGAQNTLVILVNFQNDAANKPWTVAEASTLLGTVSDFYKENSAQQTWIAGSVAGWYTIPLDNTVCDGFAIQNYANAAAQNAGYNLAAYQRFIYAFPTNACGYSGMGQVNALPSATWINGSLILRTVAHELGHNLGLHHAHALDCGSTTLGTTCSSQEYGDTVDVMGYAGTVGHFNTFNKERLGWLSTGNLVPVTGTGSFYIQPSSKATTGTKVLKIPKGTDPVSGSPSYYYVEFRQPIGFDSKITERGVINTANMFNGVTIRQAIPTNGNSGYLLDMTPGSTFVDMSDAALTGGNQFTDSAAGVTITTQSVTSASALVGVTIGAPPPPTCTRSAPTIAISPGQSSWLAAGSAFTYQVSVTNKDSSACSSTPFSLSASKPTGWVATLETSALTLAPGASGTTSLVVTSPSTATDGFYSTGATVSGNGFTATTSATYVVDNPVTNRPPVAVDDLAVLSSIQPVTIAVLGNDSDPDGDSLRVVSVGQAAKGSVVVNADGRVTYVPAKRFRSSDSFSYTITDGTYTATAYVTVRLL